MKEGKIEIIKGFNELRFFAAYGVLVSHLELYKNREGVLSLFDTFLKDFVTGIGKNMVTLFFVLSGFLITYLLLKEKERTSHINVKKFYLRRVLRIWPLYYLITFISFVIIPYLTKNTSLFINEEYLFNRVLNTNYIEAFPYFLFFFSNIALTAGYKVVGAAQSWSISVEEQFYAFWPWLIKIFYKVLPLFLLVFIIIKIAVFAYLPYFSNVYLNKIVLFLKHFPVEYMAIGALASYYAFKKNIMFFKLFRNKLIIVFVSLLIIYLLFVNLQGVVLGISFAALLSIIYTNQDKIKSSTSYVSELGVISYGIYMYHPIVMFVVFSVLNKCVEASENPVLYNVLLYVCTTIFISKVSFVYFESYFLKMKKNFAVVKTKSKF